MHLGRDLRCSNSETKSLHLGRDLGCSNSETKGLAKLISSLKSVSIKQEYFYRTRHSIVASVYHILIESLTLCVWLVVCVIDVHVCV